MKHLRKFIKPIAAFLFLNTVYYIAAPSVAHALTSGPTAPEYTSFEPVDTTDMVNMASGDFTYNVPLLEIPGPAGGYPLSLSYHAGIQPDEDASWVGLGWTLNPGAINRNVNGYADDHFNILNTDRVYWEGGITRSYNLGVSVGIANTPVSVNAGLAFSQDTYQGFGVNSFASVGLSAGFEQLGPLVIGGNANFRFHDSGGQTGFNAGLSGRVAGQALGLASNVGISSNSGFYGGLNLVSGNNSLVGVSMSSRASTPSLSVGGGSVGVHNRRAGNISTSSMSYGVDIPIVPGLNVSLGYSQQRYWSDERVDVATNGVLYSPKEEVDNFDNKAFDSYTLPDRLVDEYATTDFDPELRPGFGSQNYDNYYVNAQGLSGAIRPFKYRSLHFRQNRKDNNVTIVGQYPYDPTYYRDEDVGFRFINDFSNKHLYSGGGFQASIGPADPQFNGQVITGENGNDGIKDNVLFGSRHVEWYTNDQILGFDTEKMPFNDGFIDTDASGFSRNNSPRKQIGGFKITNESGVTYHFALPAYSKEEYFYSETIDTEDGLTFNELTKPEPYAYTWHLTAITGPDFVDRGVIGELDGDDWGYWVKFNYGKWTDDFKWRTPSTGFMKDIDNEFQNYS